MITNINCNYLINKKGVHNSGILKHAQKNIDYFLRNKFDKKFLNKIVLPFWDNFNVLCCLLTKKERKNA